MLHRVILLTGVLALTGCATLFESEEVRLERCQKKGISRDVCYQEERADRRAALNRQAWSKTEHEKAVLRKIGLDE
ncbi:hypothetical protein [Pantoea sp. 1.19]|uniref:hypothetical protein n=1 Tax=Pantoea sp. 1.19 TaxID=1925589 RepID=UPI000948A4C9|nr:hypothetical protein [Pantoea sp. 1.19]